MHIKNIPSSKELKWNKNNDNILILLFINNRYKIYIKRSLIRYFSDKKYFNIF
jgi:hypothetical protein